MVYSHCFLVCIIITLNRIIFNITKGPFNHATLAFVTFVAICSVALFALNEIREISNVSL